MAKQRPKECGVTDCQYNGAVVDARSTVQIACAYHEGVPRRRITGPERAVANDTLKGARRPASVRITAIDAKVGNVLSGRVTEGPGVAA